MESAAGRVGRVAAACRRVVGAPWFNVASFAVIVLNALTLGLETYDRVVAQGGAAGRAVTQWGILYYLSYMIAGSYLLTNLLVGVVLNALQEAHAAEQQPAPQPAAGIEQRVAALRTALEELERELGAERVGAGR